eukprot:24821-Eustigmatos_ZCMA.PRE.1
MHPTVRPYSATKCKLTTPEGRGYGRDRWSLQTSAPRTYVLGLTTGCLCFCHPVWERSGVTSSWLVCSKA